MSICNLSVTNLTLDDVILNEIPIITEINEEFSYLVIKEKNRILLINLLLLPPPPPKNNNNNKFVNFMTTTIQKTCIPTKQQSLTVVRNILGATIGSITYLV